MTTSSSSTLESIPTEELEAELARRTQEKAEPEYYWGILVPEQWIEGIQASCSEVANEVAARMVRGVRYTATRRAR